MSQFKCCPGHPYSYPEWFFTPLTTEWQRPDFRPIHFGNETRFSSKTGKACIDAGTYRYVRKFGIVAYEKGNQQQIDLLKELAYDRCIDKLYIVVTSWDDKMDFIKTFKRYYNIANKSKIYIAKSNTMRELKCVADRYLQGERTFLYPIIDRQ